MFTTRLAVQSSQKIRNVLHCPMLVATLLRNNSCISKSLTKQYALTNILTTKNLSWSTKMQNRCYSEIKNEESVPIADRIGKIVKNKNIVIFMKGIPDQPMCGFSNAVVQVLRMHGIKDYDAHNILEDEELRQGIKEFSEWPTIPQIYFKGEFIGGCDILLQMHQSGDLVEELEKMDIKSELVGKSESDN